MADLSLLMNLVAKDRASQVLKQVAAESDKAGKAADRHGAAIEHSSSRGRKALGLLAGTFISSSNQALGPLQEIADKFQVIDRASEATSSKLGGRLLGVGAAALGASAFLQTLASRDQEANQRLRASIEATGQSYEEFAGRIEAAVKQGEHFGNQASTTQDALNRLTITTHNPTEALKDLGVAQDVAAAKGISLAKAAEVVGLTFNGSTRAGKQFGLHLVDVKKITGELSAAQHALATANNQAASTQQSYADKLLIYQNTAKPSLAQQLALFRAHQAVAKATGDDAAAKVRLHKAQLDANRATHAGADNVKKLAQVVHGQGEASADSFAGHLRALGARVEDTASKFGKEYGGGIQIASLATIAVGTVIESGLLPKLGGLIGRLGLTGGAFKALAAVEVSSSAQGAAAIEVNAARASAAMEAEAGVAISTAGRIRAAMAGAAASIASVALLGPGLVPDLQTSSVKGLSSKQTSALANNSYGGLTPAEQHQLLTFVLAHPAPGAGNAAKRQGVINTLDHLLGIDFTPTGVDELAVQNRGKGRHTTKSAAPKAGPSPASAAASASFDAFLRGLGGSPNFGGGGGGGGAGGRGGGESAFRKLVRAKLDADKQIEASDRAAIEATKKRQAAVNGLLQSYRDYGKGISDTAHQFTDVINSFPTSSNRNIGGLLNGLGSQIGKESRFTSELAALAKRGLSKGVLQELIEAGPSQIGLVDALFHATGAQIRTVNADVAKGNAGAAALAKLGIATKFGPNAEAKALAEAQKTNTLLATQNHTLQLLLAQEAGLARELAGAVTTKTRKKTHR